MNEQHALARMLAPGDKRPGIWRDGVLQIWVTRACDKACFGCTQGSNLAGKPRSMSVEQFELAVRSLKGYFGVIGMFGGNPATLPNFAEYCDVLKRLVPFPQRGLWCNNPMGKGSLMRDTFNPEVSNLNVHMDQKAYDEFKRDWPESKPFGLESDSRHWPTTVAMIDIIPDEAERWQKIADCDINRKWSALIGVFRGELRAWFCEIAAAHSMLHQNNPEYPDTGLPVEQDWWRRPMQDFAGQVRYHCHRCGIPLNGNGPLACDERGSELYTITHQAIMRPKRPGRQMALITDRSQIREKAVAHVTDYVGNASR